MNKRNDDLFLKTRILRLCLRNLKKRGKMRDAERIENEDEW